MTSKLKGTMDVEIPEDCSEEELREIEKVLEESMANSLGLNPEDVEVTFLDPETGEAKYAIKVDDPTLAEETQKALKDDDFVQNANRAIGENNENLPERIREVLEIKAIHPEGPEEIVSSEARDVIVFFSRTHKQKLFFPHISLRSPTQIHFNSHVSNFSLPSFSNLKRIFIFLFL